MSTSTLDPVGGEEDVYGNDDVVKTQKPLNDPAIFFGFDADVKGITSGWNSFIRFELDIPHGAVINGVQLRLWSWTKGVGTNDMIWNGGLLDPDHAKGQWSSSDGFNITNYAQQDQLPHYTLDAGAEANDPTVFYGSSPGWSINHTPVVGGVDLTVYEGSGVSGTTLVSGFAQQLEDYLADDSIEAAYRSGGVLPCAITLTWEPQPIGFVDAWQGVHSYESVTTAYRPQLYVDWNSPPDISITSPTENVFTTNDSITFTATATDLEDGDISSSIVWTDAMDGQLHIGSSFEYTFSTPGPHTVTASITDSGSLESTDVIELVIQASEPTWNQDFGDIMEEAYELCGVVGVTGNDVRTARRSMNYLLREWLNEGLNPWMISEIRLPTLTEGVATYNVPFDAVAVLDAAIRANHATDDTLDIKCERISQSSYAKIPNKLERGRPSKFFFGRTAVKDRDGSGGRQATITLWPVPNSTDEYQFVYWYLRVLSDMVNMGDTADVHYRFRLPLVLGLAAKLARKKAPSRVAELQARYETALERAQAGDRVEENLSIVPQPGYRT